MKRSKKIYTLLAILVVACIITIGVTKYEAKKEQIKNSEEIILNISGDTVTALSWENDGTALSFHKDDTWLYDEDEQFPVDENTIDELLNIFEEFGVSFIIENVEDFGQYGLNDPVCRIQITTTKQLDGVKTADETLFETETSGDSAKEESNYTYEIKLGSFSNMDSQRYVSIGDGNVYLVATDPLDLYNIELKDMIKNDEIPDFKDVSKISFSGSSDYHLNYKEESTDTYCSDDVYFAQIDGKSLPLDTDLVQGYLENISSLQPANYVNYKVTTEELTSYGLDTPDLSVSVDYSYEDDDKEVSDTFVMYIGRNQEEVKKAEKEAEKDDSEPEDVPAYLRVGDSPIIYKITAEQYESLLANSYNDLRHKEVLNAAFSDVYQVDITLDEEDYTLVSSDEENDGETIWKYQDEKINISDFRSALMGLNADSFTDDKPSEKEELALTVYLDNENYPTVSITLYRYDGSFCLAEVDGQTVSLVKRSQVVDLIEAINAIILD